MRSKKKRIVKRLSIAGTLIGVLLVIGVTLHFTRTHNKQVMLQLHLEEGLAAYDAGRVEEAVEKLGYYHSTLNTNPDVAYKLADASRRLTGIGSEGIRSAVLLAKQAADLAPTRTEPLELLLELHGQLNQQTERLTIADRLFRLDSRSTVALEAKAKSQAALGRNEEALRTAMLLTQRTPDDPEAHRLVFALLANEDASTGRPKMASYAENLGKEHANDPRFIILRIHAAAQIGDIEAAKEIARGILDSVLDKQTLAEAMRTLDLLGMRSEGDALLTKHAEIPELLQETTLLTVQRRFMRGQIADATAAAERGLYAETSPTPDLIPWALACGILFNNEDLEILFQGSDLDTAFHRAMVDGFTAFSGNEPQAAQLAFESALRFRRDDPLAGAMLADALDRVGAWKDAARQRREVLQRTPEFTTIRLAHIESLLQRQRPIEADKAVRQGLSIDPSNGALLLAHLLAVADMASAEIASPVEIRGGIRVARALEEDTTEFTPVTIPLARLLVATNNRVELDTTLDRIVGANLERVDLRALLALAKTMQRAEIGRADEIYSIIDSSDRIDPYVLLERATSLADEGQAESGLELFNTKLDLVRDSGGSQSLMLEMARAAYLDRIADDSAVQTLSSLGATHDTNATVQSLILESQSAWSDRQLIAETVHRLRAATGEHATGWRLHDARRMLVFDPTEQNAANVVNLLSVDDSSTSSDPATQLVLADAMSILGDFIATANHLERAIDAGFDNPGLTLRLISLRQSMGDIDSARRRAIALSQVEPVDAQIRRERVAALMRLGIFEVARKDADVLAESENTRDILVAANLAGRLGEQADADALLDKLMLQESVKDHVLTSAVLTLAEVDRLEDAYTLLERNRPAISTDLFAMSEATLMERTGRQQDAADTLAQAVAAHPNIKLYTAQARLLARMGDTEAALAACDAGLSISSVQQELVLLKEAIGLVDGQSGVNISAGEADAARLVVDAIRVFSVEQNDFQSLIKELRSITTEHPSYFPGWSLLVTQLQNAGRLEEAAESAQTAMRLLPADPRPARLSVDALLLIDQARRALAAADEWSRRSRPDSYQADTTRAALHARLGSNSNAGKLLKPWADRIVGDPDVAPVLIRLLATVRILDGDEDAAWELISLRVAQDERWLAHAIEISRDLLTRGGTVDAANSWLDRVVTEWSFGSEDTLRIAQARLDLASKSGSEQNLLQTLEALDRLQTLPDRSSQIDRGASLLRIAAERLLGRTSDAALHARELVASNPSDSIAQSMFALTVLEVGGDTSAALTAAHRAVELAENNQLGRFELTTALDALGRAFLSTDAPADAESAFRRILGLSGSSLSAKLGLAEALMANGKTAESSRVLSDPAITGAIERSPGLAARLTRLQEALAGAQTK